MFSDSPILNDFVYPIPYCQSETNINSILNIFHRYNCQQIAVSQQNGKWGIIDSVDLLSLISEVHLTQKLVTPSRFRSSMPQQTFGLNSQGLNSIVKPAVVYKSDMKLDEFLSCLPKDSLSNDYEKYLLVDGLGELQGKLDKNKMLEYLALEYRPNQANPSELLAKSNYCLDLLDSIPLPLKIETASGEDLYFNTCWQEITIGDRHIPQPQLQPERAISCWWIEQKQAKRPNQGNFGKDRSTQEVKKYSKGNRLSKAIPSSSIDLPLASSMLSSFFASESIKKGADSTAREKISTELDLKIDNNSVNEKQKNQSLKSTQAQLKIQQIGNWYHIKIPLADNNKEYQLVLAIEATSLPSLPKSIANKLLATLSHELKSPLTGIVGLSNLLEARKLGSLNQRQARYVELIHSSGKKMMGIVNDLTKLTTLTEGSSVESESIDLEVLCRQVYQQLLAPLQTLDTSELEISDRDEQHPDLKKQDSHLLGQLELDIEPSSKIAIACKSHLSCILFHLMIEAIEFAKSPERLKIKIGNLSGSTAITISSTLTTKPSSSEPNSNISSSLRLAIVEYLIGFVQGNLKSDRSFDSCQFTLLLPTIQSSQISSQSATASTTKVETAKRNLTILYLYPETEAIGDPTGNHKSLSFDLESWQNGNKHSSNYRYRIIEADGVAQAHTLARIWQLDIIVLEGHQLANPLQYLQLLQTSEYLSAVPLITLDNKTTQAANQIKGLSVYPCLLPVEHRRVEDLMQVIQIAAEDFERSRINEMTV